MGQESKLGGRPRKAAPEEIVRLYLDGHSCVRVAEILDMHHSSITRTLEQMGVQIQRRTYPRKKQEPRVGCTVRKDIPKYEPASPEGVATDDPEWRDYSAYREQWRAERGLDTVSKMMAVVDKKKSRLTL